MRQNMKNPDTDGLCDLHIYVTKYAVKTSTPDKPKVAIKSRIGRDADRPKYMARGMAKRTFVW